MQDNTVCPERTLCSLHFAAAGRGYREKNGESERRGFIRVEMERAQYRRLVKMPDA